MANCFDFHSGPLPASAFGSHEPPKPDLGGAIKTFRVARKLSQAELGDRAGLDKSYVSLLEQGQRSPSLSTVGRVAQALDVPLFLLVFLAEGDKDLEPELAGKLAYEVLKIIRS